MKSTTGIGDSEFDFNDEGGRFQTEK